MELEGETAKGRIMANKEKKRTENGRQNTDNEERDGEKRSIGKWDWERSPMTINDMQHRLHNHCICTKQLP